MVLTSIILITWEAEIKRIVVWGQLRQIVLETPISKISRAIWTRGVAQAVEYLLCRREALRFKPQADMQVYTGHLPSSEEDEAWEWLEPRSLRPAWPTQ
jgi:hypothetical protein